MISTLLALAGAAVVTSTNVLPKNSLNSVPTECQAHIEQAIAPAGGSASWKPGENPQAGLRYDWRGRDYPEAGYYRTLNKTVAGCAVPVLISLDIPPNAPATLPRAK